MLLSWLSLPVHMKGTRGASGGGCCRRSWAWPPRAQGRSLSGSFTQKMNADFARACPGSRGTSGSANAGSPLCGMEAAGLTFFGNLHRMDTLSALATVDKRSSQYFGGKTRKGVPRVFPVCDVAEIRSCEAGQPDLTVGRTAAGSPAA